MILGCDIGTSRTKAVLFNGGGVRAHVTLPTQLDPDGAVARASDALCQQAGVAPAAMTALVATGWGELRLKREHQSASMVNCLAKAAEWTAPGARTALCMGAQQSVAVRIGPGARVLEYRASNKCANGAGNFLEIIVGALGCELDDIARLTREADKPLTMSSQCAVFAESEVVSLVNDGESPANILAAILTSLTKNIATLCKRIRGGEPFVLGGGLAGNERIVELLGAALPMRPMVFLPVPSVMGAVGAALCAKEL